MIAAIWRPFARRALVLWVGAHGLAFVATALAAALTGMPPSYTGVGLGIFIIVLTATLLALDILRNRERLLLHDLGVRLRALVTLATLPVLPLEALLVALTAS